MPSPFLSPFFSIFHCLLSLLILAPLIFCPVFSLHLTDVLTLTLTNCFSFLSWHILPLIYIHSPPSFCLYMQFSVHLYSALMIEVILYRIPFNLSQIKIICCRTLDIIFRLLFFFCSTRNVNTEHEIQYINAGKTSGGFLQGQQVRWGKEKGWENNTLHTVCSHFLHHCSNSIFSKKSSLFDISRFTDVYMNVNIEYLM